MRIIEIHLIAFGPFTDRTLHLSMNPGIDIIHGPNEAGKSASLRALTALFYGIPVRTADNFLHDNPNLRIGARIRHSDGEQLAFVRRKGRKDTLLTEDGKTIPEAVLEKYLQGAGEELFTSMFGIDHGALLRGGEQILKGGGVIGESLFAAGMGGADIRGVIKSLEEEAGKLFLPKGKVQVIPSRINAYRAAKQESVQASLSGRDWAEHDGGLRTAMAEKDQIDQAVRRLRSEKGRLERIYKALPRIAERKELMARLDGLGAVKILPPAFGKTRRELLQNLDKAKETDQITADALARIKTKIESIVIPEALLRQAENIDHLVERLGSHRKAFKDLPRLQGERALLGTDAQNILKELRPDCTLADLDQFRLTAARRSSIRELANLHQTLDDRMRRAGREAKKCELKLRAGSDELATMKAPRDVGDLRAALSLAMREGKIEEECAAASDEVQTAGMQVELELKRLPLWTGPIESLEILPVPSQETINRFEQAFNRTERKEQAIGERIKQVQARKAEMDGKFRELQMAGPVPTEQELQAVRGKREAGWGLVRLSWQEGIEDPQAISAFAPESSLAAAYEKSVAEADQVADRLRREADRVAQSAHFRSQLERFAEELASFAEEERGVKLELADLARAWQDAWLPAGVQPLTPAEMRAWVGRYDALVQQSARLKESRKRFGVLQKRIEQHRSSLGKCLACLGEPEVRSAETLASLIHRGQEVIDATDETVRRHKILQEAVRQLEEGLAAARQHLDDCRSDLARWQVEWTGAIQGLRMFEDATPIEANTILEKIEELFRKADKIATLDSRIAGILRDGEEFQKEVAELTLRIAPDLSAVPVEQSVPELSKRLLVAREASATLAELKDQQEEREQTIGRAQAIMQTCELKLKALCREAGCADFEQLEEKEEISLNTQKLMDQLRSLEKQLLDFSGGSSLEELIGEARQIDADALPARISDIEREIEENEASRSRVIEQIGKEKTCLAMMDGSARAAEAAERAQAILAEIHEQAHRYLRVKLASIILNREIERYRAENQDPLLRRAGELFARLSLRSFTELQTGFNESDEPILLGVRGGGERVPVHGMSDGTRDQLYLALRLASLERYLEHNEPMPFIVDDILINFDDRRAEATLQILAELSERTQVILFTHHGHLIDLARSAALPCQVIELDGRPR